MGHLLLNTEEKDANIDGTRQDGTKAWEEYICRHEGDMSLSSKFHAVVVKQLRSDVILTRKRY